MFRDNGYDWSSATTFKFPVSEPNYRYTVHWLYETFCRVLTLGH